MMRLVIATTNPGKLAEVEAYLNRFSLEIQSLGGLSGIPEIVEDGATFEENALKKACTVAALCGVVALADDSGLEVDALGGAPGIYSARYAGAAADDKKNNEKLLEALRHVPEEQRTARFVCALALCDPRGKQPKQWTVGASCEGRIAFRPSGANGFGYDPLFFYPPFGKTFGEIDTQMKSTVSHRGKALVMLANLLPSVFDLTVKP
jgi:XTP/dITP diphosphohydrolase